MDRVSVTWNKMKKLVNDSLRVRRARLPFFFGNIRFYEITIEFFSKVKKVATRGFINKSFKDVGVRTQLRCLLVLWFVSRNYKRLWFFYDRSNRIRRSQKYFQIQAPLKRKKKSTRESYERSFISFEFSHMPLWFSFWIYFICEARKN